LHRLELRFAASRLVEPCAVARIAQSIDQIVPCVVVAASGDADAGGERLVLTTVIDVSPLCVVLVATPPASSNVDFYVEIPNRNPAK
jgi:hypothetical protein